jgi:hypothetical protein
MMTEVRQVGEAIVLSCDGQQMSLTLEQAGEMYDRLAVVLDVMEGTFDDGLAGPKAAL